MSPGPEGNVPWQSFSCETNVDVQHTLEPRLGIFDRFRSRDRSYHAFDVQARLRRIGQGSFGASSACAKELASEANSMKDQANVIDNFIVGCFSLQIGLTLIVYTNRCSDTWHCRHPNLRYFRDSSLKACPFSGNRLFLSLSMTGLSGRLRTLCHGGRRQVNLAIGDAAV